MPAYRDELRGTWTAKFQYRNWMGQQKWITRRGFKTKRAALEFELNFKSKDQGHLDMPLSMFTELYLKDVKPRLKESTYTSKVQMINSKILPYLGKKKVTEITASDIMNWQNMLLDNHNPRTGKKLSVSYLRCIHNQLSAILNHAVRFYGLPNNQASLAGNVKGKASHEMLFWTQEEYQAFIRTMRDNSLAYTMFEVLYWCGIREGELLALTPADIDFKEKKLSISKTFHHTKNGDYVTPPKTETSNRVITLPEFLCEELRTYLGQAYYVADPDTRLFPVFKEYLYRKMKQGCKQSGVKQIRIHDLRHSHVSLLIHLGFDAVAIAKRLGHTSVHVTYRYAHLFPSVQTEMADRLDALQKEAS